MWYPDTLHPTPPTSFMLHQGLYRCTCSSKPSSTPILNLINIDSNILHFLCLIRVDATTSLDQHHGIGTDCPLSGAYTATHSHIPFFDHPTYKWMLSLEELSFYDKYPEWLFQSFTITFDMLFILKLLWMILMLKLAITLKVSSPSADWHPITSYWHMYLLPQSYFPYMLNLPYVNSNSKGGLC